MDMGLSSAESVPLVWRISAVPLILMGVALLASGIPTRGRERILPDGWMADQFYWDRSGRSVDPFGRLSIVAIHQERDVN